MTTVAFGKAKGKAVSTNRYKQKDGDNKVRFVGGLLPRYLYWVRPAGGGRTTPIECLGFDRAEEAFTNVERDPVQEAFPEIKCSWAYAINCIDLADGVVKVFDLKKKLFEQIMTAAEDLGDPTDPETGWDIVYKKEKTGPQAFNVEYTLKALACKTRALTDEEKEAVAAAKPVDQVYPRPTVEQAEAAVKRVLAGGSAEEEDDTTDTTDTTDKEAAEDL